MHRLWHTLVLCTPRKPEEPEESSTVEVRLAGLETRMASLEGGMQRLEDMLGRLVTSLLPSNP